MFMSLFVWAFITILLFANHSKRESEFVSAAITSSFSTRSCHVKRMSLRSDREAGCLLNVPVRYWSWLLYDISLHQARLTIKRGDSSSVNPRLRHFRSLVLLLVKKHLISVPTVSPPLTSEIALFHFEKANVFLCSFCC